MKPGIRKKYAHSKFMVKKLRREVARLEVKLSESQEALNVKERALEDLRTLNKDMDDKIRDLESDNNLLNQMLEKKPNILNKFKTMLGSK